MVINPKIRGFICTNAHPIGCAANVNEQIAVIKQQNFAADGPKNVLVIGASTGYGLASRITATFGYGAKSFGVFFEKPPTEKRTASAGYYNAAAFETAAQEAGIYAKSINGDAFSHECKQQVIDAIAKDMGKIDLVIYSLASPRRTDPDTGDVFMSTLKPIGQPYTSKNLNTDTKIIGEISIEPANDEEIANTVKVMGGEDWELWVSALQSANVLADGCKAVAYTYLGDKITWPIYGQATIGKAKEDLDRAATELTDKMSAFGGQANVAVLKAVVTQASSAIPVMPLYLAALFKVMQEEGTHEGCIEQLARLYNECLYSEAPRLDDNNRFRVDELELNAETQAKVGAIWDVVDTDTLNELTDFGAYQAEFLRLFGFGIDGVDYAADVNPSVAANFQLRAFIQVEGKRYKVLYIDLY